MNTFRIQAVVAKGQAGGPQPKEPSYPEKLMKLIPAEIVALYLVGQSAIRAAFAPKMVAVQAGEAAQGKATAAAPASGSPAQVFVADPILSEPAAWLIWTILCAAGLVAMRMRMTADPDNNVAAEWAAIRISLLAFFLWVYAFGDVFAQDWIASGLHSPLLGTLLLAAGNFFLPLLYNPEPIEA